MARAEASELLALMERFAAAWNRHDIDALMSCMHPDGVYEASTGADRDGERFSGESAVRDGYQSLLDRMPDAQWHDARHFVAGDRGVTEWTFTATKPNGARIETDGCDLLTFREGLIVRKSSLRKIRPDLPAD
ncbi:nuclear transport factor 2 family protein [Streptomyces sp. DSM 41524]|uniref:Nuclear transport factor 2 family protein n=2 Tax=Streptomyces TaxID=1883 RepID=A0ABU7QCJ9_9ACTN|nr:nuclear transport factor 2 family protein [Streptomyces sp. DSM 41524]